MSELNEDLQSSVGNIGSGVRTGLDAYRHAKNSGLPNSVSNDTNANFGSDKNGFGSKASNNQDFSSKAMGSALGGSDVSSVGAGGALKEGAKQAGAKVGAEAAGAAAGAAGGPVGFVMALATTESGRKIIKFVAAALILILLLVSEIISLPMMVWNVIFHVDDSIDAPLDMKDEIMISDETLKAKEQEWAEIIDREMEKGYETVLQGVRSHIKSEGLDVDMSMGNLITSGYGLMDSGAALPEAKPSSVVNVINESLKNAAGSKSNLVKYAMSYAVKIGEKAKVPYKLGSKTPKDGMDCVGLVCFVYENFGIKLGYGNVQDLYNNITGGSISGEVITSNLVKYDKKEVDKWKEGDILILGVKDGYEGAPRFNHTGIYAGNGFLVHSSERSTSAGTTKGVIYEKLFQENGDLYWSGTYIYKVIRVADEDSLGEKTVKEEIDTNEALKKVRPVNEYEPQIYVFLRQHGYSHAAACGWLGNMMAESSCNPTCIEGGYMYTDSEKARITKNLDSYCRNHLFPAYARSGLSINQGAYMYGGKYYPGCGLVQWTGVRSYRLSQFASSQGLAWSDLDAQLKFLEKELSSGSYSYVTTSSFKNITDVRQATADILRVYEGNGTFHLEKRTNYAIDAYNRYKGVNVEALAKYRVSGSSSGSVLSSRSIAEIISAFSIYEDQYIGTFEKLDKDLAELDKISKTENRFLRYIRMGKYSLEKGITALVQSFRNPEEDLKKLVKKHASDLYKVTYGDITSYTYLDDEDEEHTIYYYSSIKIDTLTTDKIINKLFGIKYDDKYVTNEGIQMGAKDTTMGEVIRFMADQHMELIYGNHDVGNSARYGLTGNMGEGALGNPVGTGNFNSALITSYFGYRTLASTNGIGTTNHGGIDIGIGMNTPIYSSKPGIVTRASWFGSYGNCVDVKHDDGTMTRYGHLNSFTVSTGTRVAQGQQIALSGSTGNSTGPHLHFEYYINGEKVDPLLYLLKGNELARYIS